MARQPSSSQQSSRAVASLVVFAAIFVLTAHAQRQENRQEQLDSFRSMAAAAVSAKEKPANVGRVLGAVLSERGFDDEDVQEILYALGSRLLFPKNPASSASSASSAAGALSKRSVFQTGWKRIPTQARFAPFGTKLVPSRSRGESNGPTLLRYGRSQA